MGANSTAAVDNGSNKVALLPSLSPSMSDFRSHALNRMACTYQLRRKYEDVERHMAMTGAIHASEAPELR